ncbi:MAG: HAD-IA family hydrolase [Anaerolineae bacterium]|nr:HAD-IA family hydrolase [Anaerolineae bacterium]
MKKTSLKALIFDFDGLILDTEMPDFISWQEVYDQHGIELPRDQWDTILGGNANSDFDPFNYLEGQLGHAVDREAIQEARHARELETVLQLPILPGVEEYFREAHRMGLKLGVGSSSESSWVLPLLEHLGISGEFDCVVTADDVSKTKPDPEIFNLVLARLGITAAEGVVFEDSPNGITAAKTAGIFCVCVPNEFTAHLNIDHADLIVNSLAEFPLEALMERVDQNHP